MPIVDILEYIADLFLRKSIRVKHSRKVFAFILLVVHDYQNPCKEVSVVIARNPDRQRAFMTTTYGLDETYYSHSRLRNIPVDIPIDPSVSSASIESLEDLENYFLVPNICNLIQTVLKLWLIVLSNFLDAYGKHSVYGRVKINVVKDAFRR